MRTTIDLPDDLHRAVSTVAAHTRRTLEQTVAELIRRGLASPTPGAGAAGKVTAGIRLDPLTGLPLIRSSRPVTDEDVRALDDDSEGERFSGNLVLLPLPVSPRGRGQG